MEKLRCKKYDVRRKWGCRLVVPFFIANFAAIMKEVTIKDDVLRKAANEGMDAFVSAFVHAIKEAIGGELTAETLGELNSDQITLLAWDVLHEEVMDGGFVQLIHNGYGPFIFKNPFAKAVKLWGMRELSKLVYDAHRASKLPILAMGGVCGAGDAIEFMLAGATAVAVGTAIFTDPGVVAAVCDGIAAYCEKHGFAAARDLTGALAT